MIYDHSWFICCIHFILPPRLQDCQVLGSDDDSQEDLAFELAGLVMDLKKIPGGQLCFISWDFWTSCWMIYLKKKNFCCLWETGSGTACAINTISVGENGHCFQTFKPFGTNAESQEKCSPWICTSTFEIIEVAFWSRGPSLGSVFNQGTCKLDFCLLIRIPMSPVLQCKDWCLSPFWSPYHLVKIKILL